MTFSFGWVGTIGVLTAAALALLALAVLRAAPERRQNRRLALVLTTDASIIFAGGGWMYLTDDVSVAYGWQSATYVLLPMYVAAYLLFLGTLATPWARPFASTRVAWVAGAMAVAAAAWIGGNVERFLATMEPGTYSHWDTVHGELGPIFFLAALLPLLYGLVVAVSAWRRARPGSQARRQARVYAAAFITRDVGLIVLVGSWIAVGREVLYAQMSLGPTLVLLAFAAVLAYGILKHQVFDIDLKLKWTLNRGTVASAFLAVFLVVTTASSELLTDRYGWAFGGVAAGLMLFALNPLQRLGSRVADVAFPGVEDSSAYAAHRKLQVYEAALEDAYVDGAVTHTERRILDNLRDNLGILVGDARRLEADVARLSA